MQPKDFEKEFQHVSDRLAKVKKRRSDIQIPSPLHIVSFTNIIVNASLWILWYNCCELFSGQFYAII